MPKSGGSFEGGNVPSGYGGAVDSTGGSSGCGPSDTTAEVEGGASKSGFDHIENGDLNPLNKDKSKANLDTSEGFLAHTRKAIKDSSRPETSHVWPCVGFVLRVEPKSAIVRTTNTKDERYVAIKARIPEVHSLLPVPLTLPSRSKSSPDHKIIDMYPTFIAEDTKLNDPKPGELVVLSFRNLAEFSEGIFHGPLNESTSQIVGSAKEAPANPFKEGNPEQVGEDAGAAATSSEKDDCNGCADIAPGGAAECNNRAGSNLGFEAVKIAVSLIGQNQTGKSLDWAWIHRPYYGESSKKLSESNSKYAAEGAGCDDCGPFISQIRNQPGWQGNPKPYKPQRDYGAWCARFVMYVFIKAAEKLGKKPGDLPSNLDTGGSGGACKRLMKGDGRYIDPAAIRSGAERMYPGDVVSWKHRKPGCDCPGFTWNVGDDTGDECPECKVGGHVEIVEWFDPQTKDYGTVCGNCGTGTHEGGHWPAMVKRARRNITKEMSNTGTMSLSAKDADPRYGYVIRPFTA